MPKKTENEIVALPYYERNGKASYPLPNAKIEDDLIIACPKVAEKIIPIIFLPGVMGTNLKKKGSDEKVWNAEMPQAIDSLIWLGKDNQERKKLLDPITTEVDKRGKVLYTNLEANRFPSRESRDWGSAVYYSYGEPLHVLQCMLNDDHILLDNLLNDTIRMTTRQLLIGEDLGAEIGEEALTNEEVKHSYDFLFPLHVFGYNWLRSNAESASELSDYITSVFETYHGRLAIEKVILVTHSMGGLVARHYSENLGGQNKILGIVHGVMPDLGSPATYRRMKTGERGVVGSVIGYDAKSMMPVLAQSPGPLQLAPGRAYKKGWLKIHSSEGVISKPVSDPYEEIYLQEDAWWRLCEKELLLDNIEDEWTKYTKIITFTVCDFIEGIRGKYHPNTYAFYGASSKCPSDDHLIWEQRKVPRPVFGQDFDSPTLRQPEGIIFELTSSGSPGDGTVPVCSGRISFPGVRALLATKVDHEGAYSVGNPGVENGLSVAMKFTLRSIIKMVREVKICG